MFSFEHLSYAWCLYSSILIVVMTMYVFSELPLYHSAALHCSVDAEILYNKIYELAYDQVVYLWYNAAQRNRNWNCLLTSETIHLASRRTWYLNSTFLSPIVFNSVVISLSGTNADVFSINSAGVPPLYSLPWEGRWSVCQRLLQGVWFKPALHHSLCVIPPHSFTDFLSGSWFLPLKKKLQSMNPNFRLPSSEEIHFWDNNLKFD